MIKTHFRSWPEYSILSQAIERCFNPRNRSWANYGGRGIRVHPRWRGRGGFDRFIAHIGRRPSPSLTLDRIDNDRGYVPGNVRWATRKEQQRSRRMRRMSLGGVTLSTREWAKRIGLSTAQLDWRLRHGWSEQEALETPRYQRRIS